MPNNTGLIDDAITVITVTRDRLHLLKRAIESVQRQDHDGSIKHLIIIDDCSRTKTFLESSYDLCAEIEWHWISRNPWEVSGPGRLAKLRNYAVDAANTKWISFLDDDNEFESNHLSSLVACARHTKCEAIHSYRRLFCQDGTPYLEQRWPWSRDRTEGIRIYQELCLKGVLQPGSNIERDRCDPLGYPDPTRIVDTGEWLLARKLLLSFPFCEEYTYDDWINITTEDDKLLQTLVEEQIPIVCTEKPTLKYYLGGYSNALGNREVWHCDL